MQGCKPKPLPSFGAAPAFTLRDQRDRAAGSAELRGKVWIANFMFTSCPDVCPILTSKLAGVRSRLMGDRVKAQYVSFTVDPETDTPAVLAKYVADHHVELDDWRFLTGSPDEIRRVVTAGFKQAFERQPPKDGKPANILHGSHFVLIDGAQQIRGFYSSDEEGLLKLARDARILFLTENKQR